MCIVELNYTMIVFFKYFFSMYYSAVYAVMNEWPKKNYVLAVERSPTPQKALITVSFTYALLALRNLIHFSGIPFTWI